MVYGINFLTIDIVLFVIANLVNLLLVAVFLVRPRGLEKVEYVLGIVVVAMALPVGAAVILNVLGKREWWTFVLPLFLILFLKIELLFDYILKLNFRDTALRWPYIFVYYLGLLAMIGYSFSMGKPYGFVTLSTYFLNLLATWYGHTR